MTTESASGMSGIVLGAGGSTRMGQPKLLLRLGRKSLLRRAVETAQSVCERVIVVLGADADRLGAELEGLDVEAVHNPHHAEGLSSSLRCGVEAAGSVRAVLITLADQPLVTAGDLRDLVAEYERSGAPIVAATYGDTVGVPAIFDRSLFGELAGLRGDAGARAVIEVHRSECRAVPVPAAATDVDAPEDWERLSRTFTGA